MVLIIQVLSWAVPSPCWFPLAYCPGFHKEAGGEGGVGGVRGEGGLEGREGLEPSVKWRDAPDASGRLVSLSSERQESLGKVAPHPSTTLKSLLWLKEQTNRSRVSGLGGSIRPCYPLFHYYPFPY